MSNFIEKLELINDFSMYKIIFYFKEMSLDELINQLDPFNIVVCGNGLFQSIRNDLLVSFDSLPLNYNNTELNEIDSNIIQLLRKPEEKYLNKILDMFRFVNNKTKNELMTNLYYDKKHDEFIIDLCKQIINSGSIEYEYNKKYENNSRYIRYLQIHSHHSMSAHFSSTDNNDEKNKIPCYFGVIGRLKENSKSYDSSFRIWTGHNFITLDISDIFDMEVDKIDLSKNEKEMLNEIIESSEKETNKTTTDFLNVFKNIELDLDDFEESQILMD